MEACDVSGVIEAMALTRIMFGLFMVQIGILTGVIILK